jgi:hypothetical protein
MSLNKMDNKDMRHVYQSMTVKQIIAVFKEKGIKGYSKKKKSELIDILCKKDEIKSEKVYLKNVKPTVTLKTVTVKEVKKVKPNVTLKQNVSVKVSVKEEKDEKDNVKEEILSSSYWKNSETFLKMQQKESQYSYYKRMCSSDEVLQLACLESKSFGSQCEKLIQELFKLDKRTSSQNDGTRNGKGIEIKSARYWCSKDDCVWQHLEPNYDYEIVLFALLDFNSLKVWAIKKSLLIGDLLTKKIVTYQGKQGLWTKKSCIIDYLTPINSVEDLDRFIV